MVLRKSCSLFACSLFACVLAYMLFISSIPSRLVEVVFSHTDTLQGDSRNDVFLSTCSTKAGIRVLCTYSWVLKDSTLFYRRPALVALQMIYGPWLW